MKSILWHAAVLVLAYAMGWILTHIVSWIGKHLFSRYIEKSRAEEPEEEFEDL